MAEKTFGDFAEIKRGVKVRKLNIGTSKHTTVYAVDEVVFNANHHYQVFPTNSQVEGVPPSAFTNIYFQKGPIKENGINGIHNEDLISIAIDRLESFQNSEYKCRENALAITKLEEAMMWLRKRTSDRENRGVEGTHIV